MTEHKYSANRFHNSIPSMNINTQIQEKLNYFYSKRDRIESTGFSIDPDLKRVYHFINKEIQELQLVLFKGEYEQFCSLLNESIDGSSTSRNKKHNDVV